MTIKLKLITSSLLFAILPAAALWVISLAVGKSALSAGILTGAVLLILLIVAMAAVLLAGNILRPLRHLTRGVDAVRGGDLELKVRTDAEDETGELARLVDQIRSDLKTTRDELKRETGKQKGEREELSQIMEELENSKRELEQFVHISAHDLQEPLRMITVFTRLLAKRYRGKIDERADEFIGYAVDGASNMQQKINDLLLYLTVRTRARPFESMDCEAVLLDILDTLKDDIEDCSAVVTHDHLPAITADELQVRQLLQHLIENAIKFRSNEPLEVHISAERIGESSTESGQNSIKDGWLFSVNDNGIGMEPRYKERIFAIFQRLNSGEEYSGTGIGLAICRRVVEHHGGRIWVESEAGKGSTFYFTMPD